MNNRKGFKKQLRSLRKDFDAAMEKGESFEDAKKIYVQMKTLKQAIKAKAKLKS
jgi:hypothetical protein